MRYASQTDPGAVEAFIRPIVDSVESILVEDFDFSKTYKLEST